MHILCGRSSESARSLAAALGASIGGRIPAGEPLVINWGVRDIRAPEGTRVLNSILGPYRKDEQLEVLRVGGVRVPEISLTPKVGYIPRTYTHEQARDFERSPVYGDFYTKGVETAAEGRIHVFLDSVILAQRKVPMAPNAHPWIRSHRYGWRFSSSPDSRASIPRGVRPLAKQCISLLGLDFGAVDIAWDENGSAIVWEVNTAPGIEGRSIECYKRAIQAL